MPKIFRPLKTKKKGIFDKRNDMLDDIYEFQGGGKKAEDDFGNLKGKKKKKGKKNGGGY